MNETYNILNGKYDIAATPYLQPCKQKVTLGHSLKLAKSYSRLNVRNNFFSLRITNLWNSLTEDIVIAPSLIAFENGHRYSSGIPTKTIFFIRRGRFLMNKILFSHRGRLQTNTFFCIRRERFRQIK